jgi:acetolactate decarboxylase
LAGEQLNHKAKWALTIVLVAAVACSAFFVGLQIQPNPQSSTGKDTLYQLTPYNTFTTGKYAGVMPYSELEKHGDFGIGTFDGLDGEMMALNGEFYQIPSTGIPRKAEPTQTAPYATITYFQTDRTFTVSGLNYTQLKSYLDGQLGTSSDVIYGIKVSGSFDWAQTRSPQKQSEPYPNITEALKTQAVFTLSEVSGSAVGFWFPASMSGVDYADYHMHFITDRLDPEHLMAASQDWSAACVVLLAVRAADGQFFCGFVPKPEEHNEPLSPVSKGKS